MAKLNIAPTKSNLLVMKEKLQVSKTFLKSFEKFVKLLETIVFKVSFEKLMSTQSFSQNKIKSAKNRLRLR